MENKILFEEKLSDLNKYDFPEELDRKLQNIIDKKINQKITIFKLLKYSKIIFLLLFISSLFFLIYNLFSNNNIDIISNLITLRKSVYIVALVESLNTYLIILPLFFLTMYFTDNAILYNKQNTEVYHG